MSQSTTFLLGLNNKGARRLQSGALALTLVLAFWLLLSILLVPDPGGKLLFARAQNLESRGLVTQAIRQYQLLAEKHQESTYAPQALMQAANLTLELARAGDTKQIAAALAIYDQLATVHRQHLLGGEALLRMADIQLNDLRAPAKARDLYNAVLRDFPNNRDYASEATLCLGRVAQVMRDGNAAKTEFQRVLQKYPTATQRSAEAQFRLGETFETLFKDKDHKTWARNAYEATIKNYGQSVWAGKAKERLGLLVWVDMAPRERRVYLQTKPLSSEGARTKTLLGAMRLVLAARGVQVGDAVLRGWSLTPFYNAFSPENPSRTFEPPFDDWENVAANAGLSTQLDEGENATDALNILLRELDDAHSTLIYTGSWRLVSGYDSARNEVQLQSTGARYDTVSNTDLVAQWKQRSPLGSAFSILSFYTPGEIARLKATPVTADSSQVPAAPNASTNKQAKPKAEARLSPLSAPTFVYQLESISERNAHRRSIQRAATLMRRARNDDGNLLNLAALQALSAAMQRLATSEGAPRSGDNAALPENQPPVRAQDGLQNQPPASDPAKDPLFSSEATPTPAAPAEKPQESVPAPRSEATRPTSNTSAAPQRARVLLGWRGAPLNRWVAARRQAAAFLDIAAGRLNAPALRRAADEFRTSVNALENAAALLPQVNNLGDEGGLNNSAREAFKAAAREIERARQAETRATDLMSNI